MRNFWLLALVLGCAVPETPLQVGDVGAATDGAVVGAMSGAVTNAPGLAIGVVVGDVTYSAGYGVRNLATGEPMTPDTRFAIGSTSKAFTGFALAMLGEQGAIQPRAPIRSSWPELVLPDPDATVNATPFDLTSHITGTPTHHFVWHSQNMSRDELVSRVPHLPDDPALPYGLSWSYNNENYAVAGELVERATGQSWEDWTHAHMLDAMGMSRSSASIMDISASPNWARGYNGIWEIPVRPVWQAAGPAGSIVSTADDMTKWLQTLVQGGRAPNGNVLLADASVLHEPHNSSTPFGHYGLGWVVLQTDDGCTLVEHGGHLDGYSAWVSYVPELSIGVVTLVNHHRHPLAEQAHAAIYESLLPESGRCAQIPERVMELASGPPPPPVLPPLVIGTRVLDLHHPGYGDLYLVATPTEYVLEYGEIFMPVRQAPNGDLYLELIAPSLTLTYPALEVLEDSAGNFEGFRVEFSAGAPADFTLKQTSQ